MNQIDKILPSKKEVDELFKDLATLPKGMDQRPDQIITVGSNGLGKSCSIAIMGAVQDVEVSVARRSDIPERPFLKQSEEALRILSDCGLTSSESVLLFTNVSDRSEVKIFMEEKPKKKNRFFNMPSIPSKNRRFGK